MSYTLMLVIRGTGFNGTPIPVESYAFGVNVPTTGTGTGSVNGRPEFTTLQINKMLDANSPHLYTAAATGTRLATVELSLTSGGSNQQTATYILTSAFVTSIMDSGSAHSGSFPTEEVSFAFEAIKLTVDGTIFSYNFNAKA